MLRTIVYLVPTVAILIVFYLASSQEEAKDIPAQNLINNVTAKVIKKEEPSPATMPEILKDEAEIGKIYKWRDPDGTIIISSEPPKSGMKVEIFPFQLQREPEQKKYIAAEPDNAVTEEGKPAQTGTPSFMDNPLQVYTPEGLRELIRYSNELGETIETRGELLNEMIEQM